nr:formylglycine-generating enzyme family protein [Gammaproteobacteria bacterium]
NNTGVWTWHGIPPLGFDDYGLYVDVQVKQVTQRFRWIEPGQFMMGSPDHEPERFDDEILHEVTLTQGFWLADTAVTQEFYTVVTGSNPAHFTRHSDNPVEQVSWEDTQQFIEQLNTMLPELQARLPSEAEWEYACRAGTETAFSFGDKATTNQVNYNGDYPVAGTPKGQYRSHTITVKSLPANAWGLYQMHGNVWEWCQDYYDDYPAQALIDPQGPESGHSRVIRGGSWFDDGGNARSAFRRRVEPALRDSALGFRLALAPGQPVQGGGATGSGATASATAVPAAGYSGEGGTTPPERPAAGRGFIQALRRWFKQ